MIYLVFLKFKPIICIHRNEMQFYHSSKISSKSFIQQEEHASIITYDLNDIKIEYGLIRFSFMIILLSIFCLYDLQLCELLMLI